MSRTLIIGNKRYSSWSMRPWLFLTHHGISFDEIRIPLSTPDTDAKLHEYSPSGLVPVLQDNGMTIWDSLAIMEYLTETYPQTHGWPAAVKARAMARSVSAEMHSGFAALRSNLTMNLKSRYRWKDSGPAVAKDIARIETIWAQCRNEFGKQGPWLFGEFSIADAMYAPVATRFHTYSVPVSSTSQAYVETVMQLPAFKQWQAAALLETEVIDQYEKKDWDRI